MLKLVLWCYWLLATASQVPLLAMYLGKFREALKLGV